jgi:hypothetical protein
MMKLTSLEILQFENIYKTFSNIIPIHLQKHLKRLPLYTLRYTFPLHANEILFAKLPGTVYYLQHGEEPVIAPRRPRAAAELEVRPGHSKEDQIGVVVAALLDEQQSEALDWMKTLLVTAVTEVRAWETEAEARLLEPLLEVSLQRDAIRTTLLY